jgi:hypothetical protein
MGNRDRGAAGAYPYAGGGVGRRNAFVRAQRKSSAPAPGVGTSSAKLSRIIPLACSRSHGWVVPLRRTDGRCRCRLHRPSTQREPAMAMLVAARPITMTPAPCRLLLNKHPFSERALGLVLKRPAEPTSDEVAAAEGEGTASDEVAAAADDCHAAVVDAATGPTTVTPRWNAPPRKADALIVDRAVAIAATTKPIAILRMMCSLQTSEHLSHENQTEQFQLSCGLRQPTEISILARSYLRARSRPAAAGGVA